MQDLLPAPDNLINCKVEGNVLRVKPLRLIEEVVEIRPQVGLHALLRRDLVH